MMELKLLTLPRDVLEAQLSMVELITAMYPSSDEETETSLRDIVGRAREWCVSTDSSDVFGLPLDLDLTVTIPVQVEGSEMAPPSIQMNVTVPLSSREKFLAEPPPLVYSLRQPSGISRADFANLGSGMPPDDILAAFDYIQENAPEYFRSNVVETPVKAEPGGDSEPLLRVWFYFPSLSTREKRKDLVSYASRYDLTGFVLAGKPGVLCLEGKSKNIDGYMNAIKNESWGDIPSHQKKVSERFREECGQDGRKFERMSEITDDLGERRGARKNRGDMAALEAWLKEKGVGASFSRVIMGA